MTKIPLEQKHPLDPTWRELKLLDLQTELERRGEERGDIAFTSPLWARFSLPHRDPKDAPMWEARNGNVSLIVQPGFKRDADGRLVSAGYPFGVIPRLALTFMATQAVRTHSKTIELGDSQREFMARIGMDHGSLHRKRLQDQMRSLAAAHISISEYGTSGDGWGERSRDMPLTEGLQLWLNGASDGHPALWGSTVVLTDQFFESIIDAPLPVYLEDLRALGGSSMRHDIYLWLVYRLYKLDRTTHVSWEQLHVQFGASFKLVRQFKPKFIEALNDVLKVYPAARVRVSDKTLALLPSEPHVKPARKLNRPSF